MRKYAITFLKEVNDECVEREDIIDALDIFIALAEFRSTHKVYKRIIAINEIPDYEQHP